MTQPNQEIKLSNEHQDYKWVSEVGEITLLVMPEQKKTIEKVLNTDRSIISSTDNNLTKNNKVEENKMDIVDSYLIMLENRGSCWKGYKMVGMKKKNGKQVPNCVLIEESLGDKSEPNKNLNNQEKVKFYRDKIKAAKEHMKKAVSTGNGGWQKMLKKRIDGYENSLRNLSESDENKPLNKPFRLPTGSKKKFGVYVKNDKGNVVMVKFGDPNMEIKRDDPERLKSFRARHGCDNPGPKWKAKYWSCRFWEKKVSVSDLLKGD